MEKAITVLKEMGVPYADVVHIRTKDGISLYSVHSKTEAFVLKLFEKPEYTPEIDNYVLLNSLGIRTLPVLNKTPRAILLPDVNASKIYRLGEAVDLSNGKTARAIARWYSELHQKGYTYLHTNTSLLYDESDSFTAENMRAVAKITGTQSNPLWDFVENSITEIRKNVDNLPRTLTYNDFYWTNLVVSRDGETTFMLDYNLLGKGYVYGDIRNVTYSLSYEAKEAFLDEYGEIKFESEVLADSVIGSLTTLHFACQQDSFPKWGEASLAQLQSGETVRNLKLWLESF